MTLQLSSTIIMLIFSANCLSQIRSIRKDGMYTMTCRTMVSQNMLEDNYVHILKSCSISVDLSISSKEMKKKILANKQIILSAYLSKNANEHANIANKRKSEDSNVNYASPLKKTYNDMSFHK